MSGTKSGGKRAADTNRDRWGADFYRRIGQKGGKVKGIKKGFALNRELASIAGAIGGHRSRRTSKKKEGDNAAH